MWNVGRTQEEFVNHEPLLQVFFQHGHLSIAKLRRKLLVMGPA